MISRTSRSVTFICLILLFLGTSTHSHLLCEGHYKINLNPENNFVLHNSDKVQDLL